MTTPRGLGWSADDLERRERLAAMMRMGVGQGIAWAGFWVGAGIVAAASLIAERL